MKITKLGHCCLLIEEGGLRILTDPGFYTIDQQTQQKNLNLILVTHEHADHFHLESLKKILENNPSAKILTNTAVGKLLTESFVPFEILQNGEKNSFSNVEIAGFGKKHALVYDEIPVQNVGYFIGKKFFYPGDALTNPDLPVELLALPVCGPWLKLAEAINFAKEVKPKICFPVHDGMLNRMASFHLVPQKVLAQTETNFIIPKNEKINI